MADQSSEWLLSGRKAVRVFAPELFAKRGSTHFKRILSYDNFTMNTSIMSKNGCYVPENGVHRVQCESN